MEKVKFYKISEISKIAPEPVPKSSQSLKRFILKHKSELSPTITGSGKGKRYFIKKEKWEALMKKLNFI